MGSPGMMMKWMSQNKFYLPLHLKILDDHLLKVAKGEIKRLIITMPPRHGKTLLTSTYFPVWYLMNYPDKRVVLTSYGSNLAYEPAVRSRDLFKEWAPILKDLEIDPFRSSSMDWAIKAHLGGFYAVGRRGSLTGKGASLLIIDDPIKDAVDASSERIRQSVWDWYASVASTRMEPDGSMILIQCMTGDTPVLLANGTERPLREIAVGDRVATYDNGTLGVSTVRDSRRNHPDTIYRITTNKGTTVRANERHPFLVENDGGKKQWIRLRDLTMGHRIVTLRGSGESGKENAAWSRVVRNPLAVEDTASHTTTKRCGQTVTAPHQLILSRTETLTSNTATESPPQSTTRFSRRKMADVPSVNGPPETTNRSIGRESCASIIATKPIALEGSCATTVTLLSDTPKQLTKPLGSQTTSDFTTETIVSIEPTGVEEVFDLQIERTENFIANGVVSHNTRWHEDDLAGRIIHEMAQGGEHWDVLNMPAIAEERETYTIGDGNLVKSYTREPGDPLWYNRFGKRALKALRRKLGDYFFAALYQQRPVPLGGGFFKNDWLQFYDPDYLPYMDITIQSWDTAQTKSSSSDFVVGQVWGKVDADFYLLDQVRGRWDFDETVEQILNLSKKWDTSAKIVEAQTLGAALASHLKHKVEGIIPISVRASKELRAQNCLPVWQSKNVYIPKPDDGEYAWVYDYVRELLNFPNAVNDDQVDATTLALNQLRGGLFPEAKESMDHNISSKPMPEHTYFIGWVPARQEDAYAALVLDLNTNVVVSFGKYMAEPIENQLASMFQLSRMYNGAVVRAFDGVDEALLFALEVKGVYVQRIKMSKARLGASYENLAMLMRSRLITFPYEKDLLAELEVFKSEFTLDESPDYSNQIAAQASIHALCLVTFDMSPQAIKKSFEPSVYYSFDRSLF